MTRNPSKVRIVDEPNKEPDEGRLLTYRQVSELAQVPLGTLYAKVHARELAHVRLGPRTVRFRACDIEAWIAAGYTTSTTQTGE